MTTQAHDHDDRPYRSIRAVLELLVEEYPDMTISKIRFLESRGLIEPERTPSGYRKFYDADVERLRWILRQQREHFLPLKVIKGRLEQGGLFESEMSLEPSLFDAGGEAETPSTAKQGASSEPPVAAARPGGGGGDEPPGPPEQRETTVPRASSVEPPPARGEASSRASRASRATPSTARGSALGHTSTRERARQRSKPSTSSVSLSVGELIGATGSSEQLISDLVEFGLIEARVVGGEATFSDESVEIAKIAVGFAAFGLEPRHLRSVRNAAERQAGTYLQVVSPLLRQRNPAARERADSDLDALMSLGSRLHDLFVEMALRNLM